MLKYRPKKFNTRGFTLIELILVIGLSSILVLGAGSMLIFGVNSYTRARANAQAINLANDLIFAIEEKVQYAYSAQIRNDTTVKDFSDASPMRGANEVPYTNRIFLRESSVNGYKTNRIVYNETPGETSSLTNIEFQSKNFNNMYIDNLKFGRRVNAAYGAANTHTPSMQLHKIADILVVSFEIRNQHTNEIAYSVTEHNIVLTNISVNINAWINSETLHWETLSIEGNAGWKTDCSHTSSEICYDVQWSNVNNKPYNALYYSDNAAAVTENG